MSPTFSSATSSSMPNSDQITRYLRASGWTEIDRDDRTSAWRFKVVEPGTGPLIVVLPHVPGVIDYEDRAEQALRVISWAEQRLPDEVLEDISFGGADTVAVRTHPNAPTGQVSLSFAKAAVDALRDYVVGSASASILASPTLVLPARRPHRAENYADLVRLSSQPGSFVLSLALPLSDESKSVIAGGHEDSAAVLDVPFGRQVMSRMSAVAARALELADEVALGRHKLTAFGRVEPGAPNATELSALGALGGEDFDAYELRFAASPVFDSRGQAQKLLTVTPGQQRILREASEYLRARQPRPGVTVVGLVVKLERVGASGAGDIVVQGPDDDSGVQRRFRIGLSESDYNGAVRAHQQGLLVGVSGDLVVRGNRRYLQDASSFGIIPELDDE